jgi:caa(3)-type oxidase subunit IV
MDTQTTHEARHAKPITYVGVFVVLGVLTAIEVGVTQIGIDKTAASIALLAFMTAKALLVMMFYMHLKYDTKTYSLSLVLPFFMALLLAIVVIIASLPR